ncbi:murein hydrolase activator EnvC [Helicobacter sp.]|uniref:murein hydrolase activator EnvC family protein n=1 Tax=Helicobacter sp. TaxID=218 RepID=UPI0019AC17D8|nr:M23 family metallopeptidase [Helicobacter sp.]MBD5165862.1 peptidoglycan DD-metalloendopeptidase family protein [Helicobacter sp.]
MRIGLIFIIVSSLLFGINEKEITQKINQNKNTLEDKKRQEKQINAKLQELGNAINQQKEEHKLLQKTIKENEQSIAKNQKEYNAKSTLIKKLSSNQDSLFQTRKQIELEMMDLIAKEVSFAILLNDFQPESIQDLITEEAFKSLSAATKKHLSTLSDKQSEVIANLHHLKNEIEQLKNFLDAENQKRTHLKALQNEQETLIANYQKEITKYNGELQKIVKERDAAQEILVNLNILKSQEEEKRKKREELAKTKESQESLLKQAPKATNKDSTSKESQATQKPKTNDDFDVRQVASSYHNIGTTKYKGAKTIAPLENFSIEKHFGPYFDPVYKMKVFNESVTLSPKGDDKVKSVLDGKVVFAKDTPILKRVVIIEHKDNMHTIYAQLDKIAPTIKPGSTVKKGYTIGRVENALKFEVTLKDKHIDPLELITTKNL